MGSDTPTEGSKPQNEGESPEGLWKKLSAFFDGATSLVKVITGLIAAITALVLALVAAGLIGGDDTSTTATTDVAALPGTTVVTLSTTTPTVAIVPPPVTSGVDEAVTPTASAVGCTIVVANPLVDLLSLPDTFSQTILRVAPGTYPVEAEETTTFVSRDQRWFLITVSGKSGWIQDSTFNIASKSAACP